MSIELHLARVVAMAFWLIAAVMASAVDAAQVENTATMSFAVDGARQTITSNKVTLDVGQAKRPTRVSFHLPPVAYEFSGEACSVAPAFQFTPAPIDAETLARSPVMELLDPDEPLILVLDNPGGNRDPAVRETSRVDVSSNDFALTLELTETAPDSGIFAGGIAERGTHPEFAACDPRLERGAWVKLSFTEDDYSYGSAFAMLVDPAGYVFDSLTGALIDGAEVTLLDEAGRPAEVWGDDGVSRYPSTVVSGGSATDASGRPYRFDRGNYRFPLVAKGRYQLRVRPPVDYSFPSAQPRDALAKLKDPLGRPFILNDASVGAVFAVESDDPFYSDIPLDRQGQTKLLLTKTASVREASPGDFIQYRVTLANRGDRPANAVHVTDILPAGLRYERGSTRGASEAKISSDGRNLAFDVPTIGPGSSVELRYVVSVAPGAPKGEAVNRVLASGAGGVTSNEAAASVRIKSLLFTDGFTLIGRVTEGDCRDPVAKRKGIAGVRLMLEDGTFVITDRDGLYHIEGIRPGRHVVQLDTGSIPASHEAVACDADTRQTGSAISRFVESEGGLLKRVDFQLRPTGRTVVATSALPIEVASAAEAAGKRDRLTGQEPGIAMLFPEIGHNPRAPVLRVAIKHYPGQRVALTLNGAPIDPLAFDSTDSDEARQVAISTWSGLPLHDGDNRLEARVLDASGVAVQTMTRLVHSASVPVAATMCPKRAVLPPMVSTVR